MGMQSKRLLCYFSSPCDLRQMFSCYIGNTSWGFSGVSNLYLENYESMFNQQAMSVFWYFYELLQQTNKQTSKQQILWIVQNCNRTVTEIPQGLNVAK